MALSHHSLMWCWTSVVTSLQLQVYSCHCLSSTHFGDPPTSCFLLFLNTLHWSRLIWQLLVCQGNWLRLNSCWMWLAEQEWWLLKPFYLKLQEKGKLCPGFMCWGSTTCHLLKACGGPQRIAYADPNFKIHRQKSCCMMGTWHGEKCTRSSPLVSGWLCCLSREMETLSRSRPKRVDVAGMVVVPVLGAGCLGSAVVFQHDAALPDEVQPRHMIPYQIGALGDWHRGTFLLFWQMQWLYLS